MILPDHEIRDLIRSGHIIGARDGAIKAGKRTPDGVQPASLEVHISAHKPRIHCRGAGPFNPNKARPTEEVEWMREGEFEQAYLLPPHHMVLLATEERVVVPPNMVFELRGCSTIGRNGITAHITAGWIDPGFDGLIVLEVFNSDPYQHAILAVGERIGQLSFAMLASECERPYGSAGNRYQGQDGVVPARGRIAVPRKSPSQK